MRIFIALTAIAIPALLLRAGQYGSFLFSFSIPLLWQVTLKNRSLATLGFKRASFLKTVGFGVGSGILLSLLGGILLKSAGITGFTFAAGDTLTLNFLFFSMDFALAKETSYRLLQNSATSLGLAIYFLFNIFAVGLGEEMLWRAFIQQKLKKIFATPAAIMLTGIGFALIHFYLLIVMPFTQGALFLAIIGLTGVIWGYLYEYCDNLWTPAVSHGIVAAMIWKYTFFQQG